MDWISLVSLVRLILIGLSTGRVPQTMRLQSIGLLPYRVFTLEEIEDATNNFDPLNSMGEGSQGKVILAFECDFFVLFYSFFFFFFGSGIKALKFDIRQVYKGWLSDGSVVLVKCLKLKQKHISQSAIQNIEETLPKLRHRHLVSVLGHCIVTIQDHPNASTTVFVVLEHISNGTLGEYVTGTVI